LLSPAHRRGTIAIKSAQCQRIRCLRPDYKTRWVGDPDARRLASTGDTRFVPACARRGTRFLDEKDGVCICHEVRPHLVRLIITILFTVSPRDTQWESAADRQHTCSVSCIDAIWKEPKLARTVSSTASIDICCAVRQRTVFWQLV
jgi:hypothetical protein